MEHDHFVSAAALVSNDAGKILLVRSPRRGWEYPGGMIEPGESVTDGLLREIREESGVDAEILSYVGFCKNVGSDGVNHDFRCRYVSGSLRTSSESPEVGWFSPEEAVRLVTFPVTKLRLAHMLCPDPVVYIFSFRHTYPEEGEPTLTVVDSHTVPVGISAPVPDV